MRHKSEEIREIEKIVAAAISTHPEWTRSIYIESEMFQEMKPLVKCMLLCIKKGRTPDLISVRSEGGHDLTMQLMGIQTEYEYISLSEFQTLVDRLYDNYMQIAHERILGNAYTKIKSGSHPGEIMKKVNDEIESLYKKQDFQTFPKQVENTIEQIDKAMQGDSGISWGWDILDEKAGRLQKGDLVIIAGRAGMGKTEFALKIAEYSEGEGAGIISLEMPHTQLIQRFFQERTGISVMKMRSGKTSAEELKTIITESEKLVKLKLQIEDRSFSLNEIEQSIYQMVHAGAKKIVIDYLQKIKTSGKGLRDQELGAMTSLFKELAMRLQIPIILLAQINRGVESREDKRPNMSDIRETGNAEADADMIICLYREGYYNDECRHTITEILFRKHRHGFTGVIPLLYKGSNYIYSKNVDDWYRQYCKGEAFGECPEPTIETGLPRLNRSFQEPIDFTVSKKIEF